MKEKLSEYSKILGENVYIKKFMLIKINIITNNEINIFLLLSFEKIISKQTIRKKIEAFSFDDKNAQKILIGII